MKSYFIILALSITISQVGTAQRFENHTQLSLFTGVQNPREVAVLDLGQSGPGEYFDPGVIAGIGISRKAKRISISCRGAYIHNQLKNFSDVEQNSNLHNVSLRGDFWVNLLNPGSRFRLEIGTGLGIFYFRHPGYTLIWDEDTDMPGKTFVMDPYPVVSYSLNSGINLSYAFSKRFDLVGGIGNDLILAYANEESVILMSLTIGIHYKL